MKEKINNYIKIYDEESATVANVTVNLLAKLYFSSLFSNAIRHSKCVIAYFAYPNSSSTELTSLLELNSKYAHILKIGQNKKEYNLPAYCLFSIKQNNETKANNLIQLLTQCWLHYGWTEIYFIPDELNFELKEKIILKSRIQYAFDNKNLKDFIGYCKNSKEDYDILVYNDSKIPFENFFTPDPILAITPLLESGILYKLDYSDELIKTKKFLDDGLQEIGLPNSFDNGNFEIDLRSNNERLIFNIQKNESVPIQLILEYDYIEFNIDRVEYTFEISNKEKNKQKLREKLKLVFYSKVRVEYKGNDNCKIYFLDRNDRVIDKIIRCPFYNLFSKKETFTYAPIYQQKI